MENQDEYPTAFIPPNFLNFNIEISKKDLEKYLKKKGHKFSAKWVSGNITIIHYPSAIFSKAFIGDSISGAKIVQYNYSGGQEIPSYVTVYIDHSKVNILDTLKFLVQKLGPPSSYAKSIKEKDLNFYIDWVNGDPNSHISSITLDSHDSFIGDFQVNPLSKFSYSITIYSNAHGCTEQD